MIEKIRAQNRSCRNCKLCKNRVVTSIGNGPIMLVEFHPDYLDDTTGEPFSGRKGDVINKLFHSEFAPEDLSYTFLVKCKPNYKSKPTKGEIDKCKVWLWNEIKSLEPRVIVPMGKVPTETLLGVQGPFKDHIGQVYKKEYTGAAFVPFWASASILMKRNEYEMLQVVKKIKEQYDEYSR